MRALRTLAFALALSAPAVTAGQTEALEPRDWRRPLGNRNQVPLALLFVSLTPEGASTIDKGQLEIDAVFDYSNMIFHRETETELLHLDMEYLRTLFSVKRGFGAGFELGVELPFYAYFGGILDPFVSSFHQTFGLPNALRGSTPPGLTQFAFRRGGEVILEGSGTLEGMGDLTILAKKELLRAPSADLSLRGAVKLPTGDPSELTGSGAADVGLGFAYDWIRPKYGLYLTFGYHFLGDGGPLAPRDYVALSAAADWRFKPRLAAVLQTDFMTTPIQTSLLHAREPAMNLGLGLRYHHSESFTYEWRFVEDLSRFAPDFTFAFQVEVRTKGAEGKGR
jgi:hypothetical protein